MALVPRGLLHLHVPFRVTLFISVAAGGAQCLTGSPSAAAQGPARLFSPQLLQPRLRILSAFVLVPWVELSQLVVGVVIARL